MDKKEMKEYQKNYYQKNKEKVKAYKKRCYEEKKLRHNNIVPLEITSDPIDFKTCEVCGCIMTTEVCPVCSDPIEIRPMSICSEPIEFKSCECGSQVFVEEDEEFCISCGKVSIIEKVAEKKEKVKNILDTNPLQPKFSLSVSEVLNKIISEDNQLFLNLANKYSSSCGFLGDKEDLYQDLICKVYDIYNSQDISRFETYNDFRSFLITSLKNYCLNLVIFSNRHVKKEGNEIPEGYSFKSTSAPEYKDLTEREKYLIDLFDHYDCDVYEGSIKKWDMKRILNLICMDLGKKEGTDPHYILREYKTLAAKL